MEEHYKIRNATFEDVDFLVNAILSSEKGGTNKLAYATLFDLDESDVFELIKKIILKDVKGCDFSIENFLLIAYNEIPVASVTGWIEPEDKSSSSSILKSNLIGFTFPVQAIKTLSINKNIIEGYIIEREKSVLQIEHVYVDPSHRGRGLSARLIKAHVERAKEIYPNLDRVHLQVYRNNQAAIKSYKKLGFKIINEVVGTHEKILDYLPYNVKLLMEQRIFNMDQEKIWEKLRITLKKVLEHESFELSENLVTTDIDGWTSLTHMIIIREIEITFDISFDLEEYNQIKTIGSLTELIKAKLN